MRYICKPTGICCEQISFDITKEDDLFAITNLRMIEGCTGQRNLLSKLVKEVVYADDLIYLLKGIECVNQSSCSNELAKAIENAVEELNGNKGTDETKN